MKRLSVFPQFIGRSLFREILWFSGLFVLGVAFGIASIYLWGTPSVEGVASFPFKQSSVLYDRTGSIELYRLYGEENRTVVGHDAIPAAVRLATIASEDAHFYSHQGIDPLAILRALKVNLMNQEIEQGASTITQQLTRNLFLTRERTLGRKVREIFLAVKIDRYLDKDTILDMYLNAVPYGSNAYGIQAAAETYFKKDARNLSIDESAFLAALPNAPTYYSPYGTHKEELRRRQHDILRKMYDLGLIDREKFDGAIGTDTLAKVKPIERPIRAPHFVFYTLDTLREKYGQEALETGGYAIYTTLDHDLQQAAEKAVKTGAAKNLSRRAENAALVSINPRTGEVLAMVGSKDYFDPKIDGQVNVTTRARQPGSSFKPFAYAKAFEKGFQPETPLYDVPINFGPDGSGKDYIPHNYDGRYHGKTTMRGALAMSLNIPAVQTLALAGVPDTIELATRLGITTLTDPKRYGLALVLGGAEVRPLDMASAFSVFSQEGVRHDIQPISRLYDRYGRILQKSDAASSTRVLDTEIARKINSILSDNQARTPIFGPRSPLAFPKGVTVAAKTGTTQNFRDAWTVGYTGSIAAAVWVGNNDNRAMAPGSDGIFVAAPIFREYMDYALTRFPETGFTPYTPSATKFAAKDLGERLGDIDVDTVYIDKKTGREVSKKKAKKLGSDKVEKRSVLDLDDDEDKPGTVRFEDMRKLYTPAS